VLALRGDAGLVAHWAQLASLIEVVAGVALAGVGTGLSVCVAQAERTERQTALLRGALRLGLTVSLPVALAFVVAGWYFTGDTLPRTLVALAALAGWIAVIPGLLNSFWLGRQRRDLMLALAVAASAVGLAVAIAAPPALMLELLVLSQALPAVAILFVMRQVSAGRPGDSDPLKSYVLPGLAIGILSPGAMLVARAAVAQSLSWHEASVLQALWRVSDWVCGFASGVLAVQFLPRLAAAPSGEAFAAILRRAAFATLVPSAAVFAALYAVHAPLVAWLYNPAFAPSDTAVAWFFTGSWVRIVAWVPLFALYALRRARAIAIGELLSLPLFALLALAAGDRLTLELAGALWLLSYLVYGAFNLWAARGGQAPDRQ
jgi:O-antigen/teichoic acid export membrane protein